jgi:hypothetical protein
MKKQRYYNIKTSNGSTNVKHFKDIEYTLKKLLHGKYNFVYSVYHVTITSKKKKRKLIYSFENELLRIMNTSKTKRISNYKIIKIINSTLDKKLEHINKYQIDPTLTETYIKKDKVDIDSYNIQIQPFKLTPTHLESP